MIKKKEREKPRSLRKTKTYSGGVSFVDQDTREPEVHFPPTVFGPKLALPASSLTSQNPGLDQP